MPFSSSSRPDRGPRTAKAMIPFGPNSDMILDMLEGGKRRMKDGRLSFSDSPKNLEIIRNKFPNLTIELPPDFSSIPGRMDVPVGVYQTLSDPPPYTHQREANAKCRDATFFGLFMEQGTGKTRVAIDKAGYHFGRGEVTGVLVITKKGVHRQWVEQQIPTHIGTIRGHRVRFAAVAWNKKPFSWSQQNADVLEFFSINFNGISTKTGRAAIDEFLIRHRGSLMIIIDESHEIKTYDAVRTLECVELGQFARFRLILSGTPIPLSLEDEWSQSLFLSESIFGMRYVSSFRNVFTDQDGNPKNIDLFRDTMAPHTFRVTKDEALDLPEKIRISYHFDLSQRSRNAYNSLRRNFLATVEDQGKEVTVTVQNGAVLVLRLQQITGGILVGEDKEEVVLGTEREDALAEVLSQYELETKIIIWGRFKRDLDAVERVCGTLGKVVRLDGDKNEKERDEVIHAFMNDPSVKFLAANQAVGGTGHNFQGECRTNIYYSNSFNSIERWQSEDRTHRIGTHHPVTYVDLIATNTVDELILRNLQDKKDFADLVLDVVEQGVLEDE